MSIQVTWTWDQFVEMFPEFSVTGQAVATAFLPVAQSLHDNSGQGAAWSGVQDAATQLACVNFVLAHVLKLFATTTNGTPSPLVGRINAAGEGSVNVSTELEGMIPDRAFWSQTQYGMTYWELTQPYRRFYYVPGKRRRFDPWRPM